MKRTILVCGHGPGISDAMARKFGREGYRVAIVARNGERLVAAAKALSDAGVEAKAFPCDLGNVDAVRALVREVRASLGPIGVVHWNAYAGGAGDLTTAKAEELRTVLDVTVHGMLAAVQESLPDLEAEKGAVLITGGGFGIHDPKVDEMCVNANSMGLAIGKAAQAKIGGMLNVKLAPKGVYAGVLVVTGLVKGTAWDQGNATLEPSAIADKFWDMAQKRDGATFMI